MKSKGLEILLDTGMINRNVFGGIQIDVNAVWRRLSDGTFGHSALCNHNCTIDVDGIPTGGKYVCPASTSLNKGVDARSLAPTEAIERWVTTAMQGHRRFRDLFLNGAFPRYASRSEVPPLIAEEIKIHLCDPLRRVEVNIFGGNPEMLPGAAHLIRNLTKREAVVNLTTTGRRFITDQSFAEELEGAGLNVLALSFDDLEPAELGRLAEMSLEELRTEWMKTKRETPNWGQRLKAYEGLYAARIVMEKHLAGTILFNMVIHPGNVWAFAKLFGILANKLPDIIANPYPAQSSFLNEASPWTSDSLELLEELTDYFIRETFDSDSRITRRLHYWLFLKASFTLWRGDYKNISRMIAGYDGWRCYRETGAGRHLQIGCAPSGHRESTEHRKLPGGHLGCFWNTETVTKSAQLGDDPDEVVAYLAGGAEKLALNSSSPCRGCVMPRLMFDMISTEIGMDGALLPTYLNLRKEYVGF